MGVEGESGEEEYGDWGEDMRVGECGFWDGGMVGWGLRWGLGSGRATWEGRRVILGRRWVL